ncbi:hypothetical protein HNR19_002813 [Nocardioides thalensis]|uniref:Peptidase S24/S26A/S26B/S26C domain-containing protein n=1 Tax=Nocardioides thalensis TaxID=1914755 RepID=A0A853C362_9ACTN|nr:hypothetical protein [Nocardioides thalensis]
MSNHGSAGRPEAPARSRWGFAVVRGDSMRPALRPGDRLLVRYGARVLPGRVVVARFADGTVVVKRAVERRSAGWWLLGDAPAELAPGAVDSRHRGPVADDDVLAVAVARVWPRPRRL